MRNKNWNGEGIDESSLQPTSLHHHHHPSFLLQWSSTRTAPHNNLNLTTLTLNVPGCTKQAPPDWLNYPTRVNNNTGFHHDQREREREDDKKYSSMDVIKTYSHYLLSEERGNDTCCCRFCFTFPTECLLYLPFLLLYRLAKKKKKKNFLVFFCSKGRTRSMSTSGHTDVLSKSLWKKEKCFLFFFFLFFLQKVLNRRNVVRSTIPWGIAQNSVWAMTWFGYITT